MDGFIMENPIKMDDLGVPVFLETPIWSVTCYTTIACVFFSEKETAGAVLPLRQTGTISRLHHDTYATHVWLSQIRGRKQFICYPPEDTEKLGLVEIICFNHFLFEMFKLQTKPPQNRIIHLFAWSAIALWEDTIGYTQNVTTVFC